MNYFAHGRRFLDDPYFVAGTAVPDWLSAVDRRVRVRRRSAEHFTGDADPALAAVARGIVQHLHDDDWFHRTRAFAELCLELTVACRDALPDDHGLRPSFLGHILVELLLDDALARRSPELLDRYYAALDRVDSRVVQAAVNRIAARPTWKLAWMIDRFRELRIVHDYADDARLLHRLNQVMGRARQPRLPDSFQKVLAAARPAVAARWEELLEGESARR